MLFTYLFLYEHEAAFNHISSPELRPSSMACFLGCFGFPSKRRRRKPATKILPGDQILVCYEPLESSASAYFNSSEKPNSSNPHLSQSNKAREQASIKIRKKVSFNLNVQTYEPIQVEETAVYHLLESDQKNENQGDSAKTGTGNSQNSTSNYPSNYRYLNCRDSYDEEDEIAYDESDLDCDDADEDDSDDANDIYSDESKVIDDQTSTAKPVDHFETETVVSSEKSLVHVNQQAIVKMWPGRSNDRIRSQYVSSVLNPVENTTQWKAIKERAPKHKRKENIGLEQELQQPISSSKDFNASTFNSVPGCNQSRPLLQDIAVNASLSSWLGSPNPMTTNSNIAINNMLSEKITGF